MNTSPLYRTVLRQAFNITLRYKALWFLGFVATFLGLGGEYQFLINQYLNFSDGGWEQALGVVDIGTAANWLLIKQTLAALSPWLYLALALIVILAALFIWVIISAQGALVRAVGDHVKNNEVSLGKEFTLAAKSGWSLLGILISARLLALFLLAVVGLPLLAILFAINDAFVPLGATILFFALAVPITIVFSLVSKLAVAYHLIERKSWRESLARALSLFAGHWLVCLELALILLPISLIVTVFFIPLASLLSVPFLVFGLAVAAVSSTIIVKIFFTLALVLFFFLLLVLGSALATFQSAVWTVLFLRIKDAPAQSKLVRLLHNWREKYG